MAMDDRLDAVCTARSWDELSRAVLPDEKVGSAAAFQRRFLVRLLDETDEIQRHLHGTAARAIEWLVVRFQVEDLKVLLRGLSTGRPFESLRPHLVRSPEAWGMKQDAFSWENFSGLISQPILRDHMRPHIENYQIAPQPFFLESVLDQGWLREWVARTNRLRRTERESIHPLVAEEVDLFHLSLAARAKFFYRVPPEILAPLHVEGGRVSPLQFRAMLVVPAPPAMSWNPYLRQAIRAFRRSHMGIGAVVAYLSLRRMEVRNLITLSEGIRFELAPDTIRSRLLRV